ncbi:MAG: OmpH family outer membrane protein [Flavobacteriales bacterium]|nr:OmpH family outer membrane protein [Flavobacteriales bacterium]
MNTTLTSYIASLLLIVGMTACDSGTSDNAAAAGSSSDQTPVKEVNTGTMKFAYVNTDSLSSRYEMIKDFEEEILQERLEMESQLQGMVRSLEKDYTDAQAGAAGLSDEALSILQQKLGQKEQQVMQQKSQMEERLMRSEQDKTGRYLDRVQNFLTEYGTAEGYDIVYGFNGLNNVLYIDKAYDITDAVVDSLNSIYAAEQAETALEPEK